MGGLLGLVALNEALIAPRALEGSSYWLGVSGDLVVLSLLLWLGSQHLSERARPWLRGLVRLAWGGLVLWEIVRGVGRSVMNEDPLLYDLSFLWRHFAVLLRDLLETWDLWALGGALLALVLGAALAEVAWRAVEAWLPRRGVLWGLLGLLAVAVVGGFYSLGRWSMPALLVNVGRSVEAVGEVQQVLRTAQAQPVRPVRRTPDVHLVVVESYGAISVRRPKIRAQWLPSAERLERHLREGGWHSVSALAVSPVSGGRSWLADTSVLTGVEVAHQGTYERLKAVLPQVAHLPGTLERAGYQTVVVRPKDRARPGVSLRNDFGFTHTVFFDDLRYTGMHVGWGWVPDQYTLGFLREEVLQALPPGPRFVFCHLASSHAPWTKPRVAADWRGLNTGYEAAEDSEELTATEQAWLQLGRFRRSETPWSSALSMGDPRRGYAQAINYDLDALQDHVLQLGERPALVVLYGDHQPPLIARHADFDVPVHVLSRDPELLKPFVDRGFVEGLVLDEGTSAVMPLSALSDAVLDVVGLETGQ